MNAKTKTKVKHALDVLMTLGLLFVSGYQLSSEAAHEWVGAGMFALFIAHHVLNWHWYKNLFRGKYTPARVFQLVIDVLLLAAMLMQMYSGILLSRHVFAFLPLEGGLALARILHILGAYWGFLLMSLHIGLHWNMVLGMAKKCAKLEPSKPRSVALTIAGALIAGYGAVVFFNRDFPTYLLLRSEFVFLDYGEPAMLFYLDYLALMGACVFLAHYLMKLCRKANHTKEKAQ